MEKFYNCKATFNGKEIANIGMTEQELIDYIGGKWLMHCVHPSEITEMNVNIVLANPEFEFPMKDSFTFA